MSASAHFIVQATSLTACQTLERLGGVSSKTYARQVGRRSRQTRFIYLQKAKRGRVRSIFFLNRKEAIAAWDRRSTV